MLNNNSVHSKKTFSLNKISKKKFLITITVGFLIIIILGSIFYRVIKQNTYSDLVSDGISKSKLVIYNIEDLLLDTFHDVIYISEMSSLQSFVRNPDKLNTLNLESDFFSFIKSNTHYDQLRYIDAKGQEKIRINFNGGSPEIVSPDKLQNKSSRYYFTDSIKLKAGQIYVSPLDLNIEGDKIEIPYKPMIRIATPVYEKTELKGIIVLNYLANEFLNLFDLIPEMEISKSGLLNSEGYWMKSIDHKNEWAFMFTDQKDNKISKDSPDLWNEISTNENGVLDRTDGVYIYFTLKPFKLANISSSGNSEPVGESASLISPDKYKWHYIHFIPRSHINKLYFANLSYILSFLIILTILIIFLSYEYFSDLKKQRDFNSELQKFMLAVEYSNDHIAITDPEGHILYGNKSVERITGYSISEVKGQKAGKAWGGLMTKEYYENMWNTIKTMKKPFVGRLQNKRKNGEIYDAEVTISPVLGTNQEILYFVAIERDITKLMEIDRAKTEFVSLASHQLRTPLTYVNWYTEMLLQGDAGKLNKEQTQFLTEIENGHKRLVTLVNDLLNVSRLELGTFIIDPKIDDVVKTIKNQLKFLSDDIQKKKISLETELPAKYKWNVDQKLFDMVVQNLLSNAVKYTLNGGKISVKMYEVEKDKNIGHFKAPIDSTIFEVSDNGLGIPKNQEDKIFSKFFRAGNVQIHHVEGTGLGLYIVKQIVDVGGGKIWFESEENKGTTFYIMFPKSGMSSKTGSKKLQ